MFFGLTDRRRTDCDEAPFRAHGLTAGTGRSKLWRHRSDIPVQSKRVPMSWMRVPCAVPRLATWSARGVSVSCVGSVQRPRRDPRGSPRRLMTEASRDDRTHQHAIFACSKVFPQGHPIPQSPNGAVTPFLELSASPVSSRLVGPKLQARPAAVYQRPPPPPP